MPNNNQKQNQDKYFIIYETTSIARPSEISILESGTIDTSNNKKKVIFEARLQTVEEVNANRRFYSREIGNTILEQMMPKASSRSLLMEVDHPIVLSSDSEVAKRRVGIVEIKNTGAILREIRLKNNDIIGVVETTSGFNGPDLANLVLYDKVPIGFSLRAFGGIQERDGVFYVTQPFKAITYDIVSNPSHSSAKIINFLSEAKELISEINHGIPLTETEEFGYLREIDKVNLIKETAASDYLEEVLNELFDKILRKVKFNI